MRIRVGYDIELAVSTPTTVIHLLRIHPSRRRDIEGQETLTVTGGEPATRYVDSFGNICGRVNVLGESNSVRFVGNAIVRSTGLPDPEVLDAVQHPVTDLPDETLQFLLGSRYCEVDSELMQVAWNTFGSVPAGWRRVQAISDWVHEHIKFDYQQARSTRTALDGYKEQVGVCRDYAHLFVTLCRCMNIPTRYVTGYLGEIGIEPSGNPMDFSAWSEVYLGGAWHTFDARNNKRRIGRIAMARGRDAADVPLTMVFGGHWLNRFDVITEVVE